MVSTGERERQLLLRLRGDAGPHADRLVGRLGADAEVLRADRLSTPQPQNSRTIGALMVMKALNDGNVWDEDQNGECHVCDNEEDDDESPMLVCSF